MNKRLFGSRLTGAALVVLVLAVAGCGGNGGSLDLGTGASTTTGGPTSTPTPTPTAGAKPAELQRTLAYERPDTHGTLVTQDILIPMRDGFKLTCDLYQPAGSDGKLAPGRFPSFVKDYTGYGRRDPSADAATQTLAAKGYNVVRCNIRGSQGRFNVSPAPQSVALINPWGDLEQQDNYDLIEWTAAQAWSNGKVGQTGISYGGITTWLLAGRQKPPHLTAIAPFESSTDNYRHFSYPNGIPTSDLRGLFPGLCSTLTGEQTCSPRLTAEIKSHPTDDGYWATRKIDLKKLTLPILYVAGQVDIFSASTNDIVDGTRGNPNFSLVLGPWEHEEVYTSPKGKFPLGVLLAFFDRWLKDDTTAPVLPRYIAFDNVPSGATNTGPVDNRWSGYDAWPPQEAKAVAWSLESNGALRTATGARGTVGYSGPQGSVTFDTEVFPSAMTLAGPLSATLKVSFDATDANLFVRVDDVDAAGTVTEKGLGAQLKMSHRESDVTPTPIVPGQGYTVVMNLASKFWTIEAGHRLRFTVKSTDPSALEPATAMVTVQTGAGGSTLQGSLLKRP